MNRKIGYGAAADYLNLAVKPTLCANDDSMELGRPRPHLAHQQEVTVRDAHVFWFSLLLCVSSTMAQTLPPQCEHPSAEAVAAPLSHEIQLDAAHPAPEWQGAKPVIFCSDWQGKNPDPERQTEVRLLWTTQTLYLRFECRYRELFVFADSDPNGRRDQLWDRDVAEAFLQPDTSRLRYYKEFEVAPNGFWIDIDVAPEHPLANLGSGLTRSVWLDERNHTWAAELAVPTKSLTPKFDPTAIWRANFYRVEGPKEPRAYFAWQPTNSPQPNFHVPSAFGRLRFAPLQ